VVTLMGQDDTVPQVVDFNRQVELRRPVGQRRRLIVDYDNLPLETTTPIVDDVHRRLSRKGTGGAEA